jgi:hypothetical protein
VLGVHRFLLIFKRKENYLWLGFEEGLGNFIGEILEGDAWGFWAGGFLGELK